MGSAPPELVCFSFGFSVGFSTGTGFGVLTDSSSSGFRDGRSVRGTFVGFGLGRLVGFAIGRSVGSGTSWLGSIVLTGFLDGLSVGRFVVGLVDGRGDGISVGIAMGWFVSTGDSEGLRLGSGVKIGLLDGSLVGFPNGLGFLDCTGSFDGAEGGHRTTGTADGGDSESVNGRVVGFRVSGAGSRLKSWTGKLDGAMLTGLWLGGHRPQSLPTVPRKVATATLEMHCSWYSGFLPFPFSFFSHMYTKPSFSHSSLHSGGRSLTSLDGFLDGCFVGCLGATKGAI